VAREMIDVRSGHSATLLPDGRVLVAGGQQGDAASEVALATAELYDPRTGTWTATGDLVEGRSRHTATLLPNGTVLIVGGNHGVVDDYARLSSAELYDPDTGTWTAAGEMNVRRSGHSATLLPDGTVLVAGGVEGFDEAWASSELYDPATRTWTATGAMTVPRLAHTATLLPNGTVLVAGGDGGPEVASSTVLASAELYDPLSGTWASTGTMTERRWLHTATLLQDGTVLVVGSGLLDRDDSQPSATAELYDPSEGTWTATASLSVARHFHTATRLPDGSVLVAGGAVPQAQVSTEVYHPLQ
jgi:N-acetylneuraminic acid mutarotase